MTQTTTTATTTTATTIKATIKLKPCMSMVFIFCCDDNPMYCYDAATAVAIIPVSSLGVAILLLVLLRPGLLLLEIAATKLRTRDVLLVVKSANERGRSIISTDRHVFT